MHGRFTRCTPSRPCLYRPVCLHKFAAPAGTSSLAAGVMCVHAVHDPSWQGCQPVGIHAHRQQCAACTPQCVPSFEAIAISVGCVICRAAWFWIDWALLRTSTYLPSPCECCMSARQRSSSRRPVMLCLPYLCGEQQQCQGSLKAFLCLACALGEVDYQLTMFVSCSADHLAGAWSDSNGSCQQPMQSPMRTQPSLSSVSWQPHQLSVLQQSTASAPSALRGGATPVGQDFSSNASTGTSLSLNRSAAKS